ncbi:hypothetical protein MCBRY_001273 [Methylocystis bryophila]
MSNPQNHHDCSFRRKFLENEARRNEANPHTLSETRTWRPARGKLSQALVNGIERRLTAVGDFCACLDGKIMENGSGIGVRFRRDDDPRPHLPREARRTAFRARCSSSVRMSPRAIDARASSRSGFAHSRSSCSSPEAIWAMRSSMSRRAASSTVAKSPAATWACSQASCSGVSVSVMGMRFYTTNTNRNMRARLIVGSVSVIAHPIDDSLRAFYARWGFQDLPFDPRRAMMVRRIDLERAFRA